MVKFLKPWDALRFGREKQSITCSISVPGCPIRTAPWTASLALLGCIWSDSAAKEGLARSKQLAKGKAIADYVQILQNHGLMQTPAKIQQKRKNSFSSHSQPPSKKAATSAGAIPVPVGPVQAQRRLDPGSVVSQRILEALRLNRTWTRYGKMLVMSKLHGRKKAHQRLGWFVHFWPCMYNIYLLCLLSTHTPIFGHMYACSNIACIWSNVSRC